MLKDIIGHKEQKEQLFKLDKIVNSYLFYGDKGIGKFKFAEEFSKFILKVEDLKTCIDYKYISKIEGKTVISVEQIREDIIKNIYEKPMSGDKKIYIIDDAEYLNTSCQNALLKTLEEPPKHVVIILVASNISNLLPTVMSRLSKVYFNKLSREEMNRYVKNHNIGVEDEILDFCNGSIGMLNNIQELNYIDKFKSVNNLFETILKKDTLESFNISKDIDFKDRILLDYFEYKCLINNKYMYIRYIEELRNRLKFNSNYDIIVDNLIINCIEERM